MKTFISVTGVVYQYNVIRHDNRSITKCCNSVTKVSFLVLLFVLECYKFTPGIN